ncbi:NADPH-dependent FMN reductase, partial [Nocardia salmonicida]
MTTRIAVVSAGLSQPSSTRLLADRLAAATARELGGEVELDFVDLR